MAEKHPVDNFQNAHFHSFPRELMGDEMAHCLSRITMNWGRVEQALYMSMKSIDAAKAPLLTAEFFSPPMLQEQKKKVRANIAAIVGGSDSDLVEALEDALTELEDLAIRRNAVSHGLWLKDSGADHFTVQPLRLDKATATFEPAFAVDIQFLSQILDDMGRFVNRMASIAAGSLARQQLNKWEEQRIAHAARIASQRD